MKTTNRLLVVSLIGLTTAALSPLAVYADGISPGIRDTGKVYSKEKPNTEWYGTGIGGRAMEAMELRMSIERLMQDGDYEAAIPKAYKAVQFDPTDPETHLWLARCLTKKFYAKQGPIDEKLLRTCMYEWNMIWHHDADTFDQQEAKVNYFRMFRIGKIIDKQHVAEAKARQQAREQNAKQRQLQMQQMAAKPQADDGDDDAAETKASSANETKPATTGAANASTPATTAAAAPQSAPEPAPTALAKRKKFLLF